MELSFTLNTPKGEAMRYQKIGDLIGLDKNFEVMGFDKDRPLTRSIPINRHKRVLAFGCTETESTWYDGNYNVPGFKGPMSIAKIERDLLT
jgi:hypothetical protein